ncbi:hypothetical protein TELCIR_18744, partial [Teladorsagia circumcincta]
MDFTVLDVIERAGYDLVDVEILLRPGQCSSSDQSNTSPSQANPSTTLTNQIAKNLAYR